MREHTWQAGQIFVFGSNLLGDHAGGAALYARTVCGAVQGVGQGTTGHAYALPTCSMPGVPLTPDEVRAAVQLFLATAKLYPEHSFFVTAVGTGIAGFSHEFMADLFRDAPDNCILPPEWSVIIERCDYAGIASHKEHGPAVENVRGYNICQACIDRMRLAEQKMGY